MRPARAVDLGLASERPQPAPGGVRSGGPDARHRDVRRRTHRGEGDGPQRPRAVRPADAQPPARPRLRAGRRDEGGGHDRPRERRLPGHADRVLRHGVGGRDGRRRGPRRRPDRQRDHRRGHRLRLRREPPRPRRPRRPQRQAVQRRVPEPDRPTRARRSWSRTRPGRTRTPTSAAATARTSRASSPPTRRPTRRAAASASPPTRARLLLGRRGAFVTAAVTAYDHLLDQPDMWGVDVINNSWGNSFQQFDPRAPGRRGHEGRRGQRRRGRLRRRQQRLLRDGDEPQPVLAGAVGHVGRREQRRRRHDEPRRVLVERPDLRQLAGRDDRRRRPHRVHRRPDRRLPPRRDRARRQHLVDVLDRGHDRPRLPAAGLHQRERGRHVDGLAARRRRRRDPAPGQPESHPRPGAHGAPVDRRPHRPLRRRPAGAVLAGRLRPRRPRRGNHRRDGQELVEEPAEGPGRRRRARPRRGRLQGREVRLLDLRRAAARRRRRDGPALVLDDRRPRA